MTFSSIILICKLISVNSDSFIEIKQNFNLNCDYNEYMNFLSNALYKCAQYPDTHEATLFIHNNGKAALEIHTISGFKKFMIVSLDFVVLPDPALKSSVAFRFSSIKSKVGILEARTMDVIDITSKKNPSLGNIVRNFVCNKSTF